MATPPVIPVASRWMSAMTGRALDVSGHHRGVPRVFGDRAEGVHRQDHAGGGQQAGALDGDRGHSQSRVASEQERAVIRAPIYSAEYTPDSMPNSITRPDRELSPMSLTSRTVAP